MGDEGLKLGELSLAIATDTLFFFCRKFSSQSLLFKSDGGATSPLINSPLRCVFDSIFALRATLRASITGIKGLKAKKLMKVFKFVIKY